MSTLLAWAISLVICIGTASGNDGVDQNATRFTTVDIYLDSGDVPLAAYQLLFKATAGDVKIVGIEGGEHEAFSEPPYYDPEAIQQERVILAAFNTADVSQLPTGRTRIATIHIQISGEIQPQYQVGLTVAADSQGERIDAAEAELEEPKA